MSRFDRSILATILGLALVIGALSVALAGLGPTVGGVTTAESLDGTLVNSQIQIAFNQPMRIQSVEKNFKIVPHLVGDFAWSGNTMLFQPRHPLAYFQTYRLSIGVGARDSGGKHLTQTYRAAFTTQGPHLLYLGQNGAEQNRLVLAGTTGARQIVGSNDGSIVSYTVSPDRSLAVYIRRGTTAERPDELWLLSLTDNSSQLVYRRPDWNLSEAHLSPDNRYIVFLATNVLICRKYYHPCYRLRSSPLVYFLDLRTHHVFPFHSSSDTPITNFIDFSPQGQIAYTDLGSALTLADPSGAHVVHIPNGVNNLEYQGFDSFGDKASFVGQTPSSSGGDILVFDHGKYVDASRGVYDSSTPAFSNSGRQIAYSAYRGEKGIEPLYGINIYDFARRKFHPVTAERNWTDWAPQWSLDDRYIAFVRSAPMEAMYLGHGEVWVMRADGSAARPLGGIGQDVSWVS